MDMYGRTRLVFDAFRKVARLVGGKVLCGLAEISRRSWWSKGMGSLGSGCQGNGSSSDVGSLGACPSISDVVRGYFRRQE